MQQARSVYKCSTGSNEVSSRIALELAQLLHHNEATISRWLLKYRCGGLAKLLEVKQAPGNPGKIPPVAVARLQQRLSQPEGFHSYGEAQQWLEQECGIKAADKTVHKLVRYRLQANSICMVSLSAMTRRHLLL